MEELIARIAEEMRQRVYGKYRGFVADNEDPEQRARLRLVVPSLLGEVTTGWALPCLPCGGLAGQGCFAVPEKDAQVWVEFAEGDLSEPIWTGTFWQAAGDPPAEAALTPPTTRLLKTPGGHLIQLDDAGGKERLLVSHPKGAQLLIDPDGNVELSDAEGAKLTLDAKNKQILVEDANGNVLTLSSDGTTIEDKNGNKIEMAAAGITLEGQKLVVKGQQVLLGGEGGEPLIKGQSFLTLFATHVHPTGVGPSGPPVPQGEASCLSTKVMTG